MTGVFVADVIKATYGHSYAGTELRVLLDIAEGRNNDTGYTLLSIEKMAKRYRRHKVNVIAAVEKLEARTTGVGIKVDRLNGASNRYWIVFHAAPDLSTTGRENATGRVVHNQSRKRAEPVAISRESGRDFATRTPSLPLQVPASVPAALSDHPALRAERARELDMVVKARGLSQTLADGDPDEIVESPFAGSAGGDRWQRQNFG